MKTLTLPAVDLHGNVLTPIVLAAMERGAKTDNHPSERDLFTITFTDETDPAIEAIEALLNPPSKKITRKD